MNKRKLFILCALTAIGATTFAGGAIYLENSSATKLLAAEQVTANCTPTWGENTPIKNNLSVVGRIELSYFNAVQKEGCHVFLSSKLGSYVKTSERLYKDNLGGFANGLEEIRLSKTVLTNSSNGTIKVDLWNSAIPENVTTKAFENDVNVSEDLVVDTKDKILPNCFKIYVENADASIGAISIKCSAVEEKSYKINVEKMNNVLISTTLEFNNASDAYKILKENGFDVDKLNKSSARQKYAYNDDLTEIVAIDNSGKLLYPSENNYNSRSNALIVHNKNELNEALNADCGLYVANDFSITGDIAINKAVYLDVNDSPVRNITISDLAYNKIFNVTGNGHKLVVNTPLASPNLKDGRFTFISLNASETNLSNTTAEGIDLDCGLLSLDDSSRVATVDAYKNNTTDLIIIGTGIQNIISDRDDIIADSTIVKHNKWFDWFENGIGTIESPFLIDNVQQLLNVDESELCNNCITLNKVHYKLTNDIDISNYSFDGSEAVIRYVCGGFDGDGHQLKIGNIPLIAKTIGDFTLNNLEVLFCDNTFSPIILTPNAFSGSYSGLVTFDNVNTKNLDATKLLKTQTYGSSPYTGTAYTNIAFKNCNNGVNYVVTGTGYAGLFLGNMIAYNVGSRLVLDNCTFSGEVSGLDLGFALGNLSNCSAFKLIDSYDIPLNKTKGNVELYINNCINTGIIHYTNSFGVINPNIGSSSTASKLASEFNASLTEANIKLGNNKLMTSPIDLALVGNDLTINVQGDTSSIKNYVVSQRVGVSFKRKDGSSAGSTYFHIQNIFENKDGQSLSTAFIKKVVKNDADYLDKYKEIAADPNNIHKDINGVEYVVVKENNNGQEINVAVVSCESLLKVWKYTDPGDCVGGITQTPTYTLMINGVRGDYLASKQYSQSDLKA